MPPPAQLLRKKGRLYDMYFNNEKQILLVCGIIILKSDKCNILCITHFNIIDAGE